MKTILIKGMLAILLGGVALVLIAAGFLHGWVVPHIDELRPRIESYISQRMGQSVRIGSIAAQSSGLLPSFDIQDAQILDAQQVPVLQLGRVQVRVSPWSLLTLELDRIVIDTPTLKVSRDAANQITVAGFKLEQQSGPSRALDWVFSQKEIVIRQGTLDWSDEQAHLFGTSQALPRATFHNVSLTLNNKIRSHTIRVQAKPPEGFGQSVEAMGQFSQPLLDTHPGHWQAWRGRVEVKISAIPALAKQLQLQMEWPLKTATIQGEQLEVMELPKLAQTLGQTLPVHLLPDAFLTTQIERFKLQANAVGTSKLKARLEAKLENEDFAGDVDTTWQREGNRWDAEARLSRISLNAIQRYVPAQSPQNLSHFLQRNIRGGEMRDVRIIFKGAPKDFPFAKNAMGEFRVTGRVTNGQFAILPLPDDLISTLPSLTKTEFAFDLKGMELEIKNFAANFAGLAMKGSTRIADLRQPVIETKLALTGDTAHLLSIAKIEPVRSFTKSTFAASEGAGAITGTLQLSLPIQTPSQTKLTGQVQLLGDSFTLNDATPPATNIKGTIHFSQSGFQLENLRGLALGGEIKLSGNGQKLMGSGVASAEGLSAWKSLPLQSVLGTRLHGRAPYAFSVDLRSRGTGLIVESPLTGMAVDLPAPMNKPATSTWPLRVQLAQTTPDKSQLSVFLANAFTADFVNDKFGTVQRGQITVSPNLRVQDLTLPERGVNAFIQLDQLNLSQWGDALASLNKKTSYASSNSYAPTLLSAQINTLTVANRNFSGVVLGASQQGQTWRFNANANDFDGYGEYRPATEGFAGQLQLRMARLVVPDANSKSQIEQWLQSPSERIPALDITVDDFEVVNKKLGRIELVAVNQRPQGYLGSGVAQEWRIKKLNITNPDAELKVSGAWLPSSESKQIHDGKRRVDIQFNLEIFDSGAFLTRLGLPGNIKEGGGTLQGRMAWVGSPWALNIPTLTGQIKMGMSKGQFLKIEPGRAGRFLSVLSLQALPRLLTLDFRDVFSDGFAFDSLDGEAEINEGILSIKNLQMKSVLALVSIDGSVDLRKETQNLHVLVLPDINAGGASLIATLINPVVGAATYLGQLILRRPIIAAATKEYTIEGTWQEPKVLQIKK